ncbi:MAG: InlB B-repeat-containing protein [Treponema sp.]|nr:InlB B-repeat-containing protein [Treponema sp.]
MRLINKIIILTALVLFFAGCDMIGHETVIFKDGENMSQLNVRIGGNARTLLPNDQFSKYVLNAKPGTGNAASAPSDVVITDSNEGSIILSYGDWLIKVTAMVTVGGVDYPAASASVSVTVESANEWVDVLLYAPDSAGQGTFNYSVRSPNKSNTITLSTLGGTPSIVFTETSAQDLTGSEFISSGIYFLTVKADNVIRNEIVHIYNRMTTEADYVFTTLDFGASSLKIGGTIKILINGVQPSAANGPSLRILFTSGDGNDSEYVPVTYTGTNGNAAWEITTDNLFGMSKLYFRLYFAESKEIIIPVPVQNKTDIHLGDFNFEYETTALAPNTWVDGYLSSLSQYGWYSINVTAGQTYYLWWNDRLEGDGTKTTNIGIMPFYEDFTVINIADTDNGWNIPAAFTAVKTGRVYIVAAPYEENFNGTFALAYSTNKNWHNNKFDSTKAVLLTANTWKNGNITENGALDIYSINVTQGQKYYLWWSDGGSGSIVDTLDIIVIPRKENLTVVELLDYWDEYHENDSAWNYPVSFTADFTGKVYLGIRAYDKDGIGTYSIVYNTTGGERPEYVSALITPIETGAWINGSINTPHAVNWYSLNVTYGSKYLFWTNDAAAGDGTKNVDMVVELYNENGYELGYFDDYYDSPYICDPYYPFSLLYIKVRSYTSGNTGTYAIKCEKAPEEKISIIGNTLVHEYPSITTNEGEGNIQGYWNGYTSIKVPYGFTGYSEGAVRYMFPYEANDYHYVVLEYETAGSLPVILKQGGTTTDFLPIETNGTAGGNQYPNLNETGSFKFIIYGLEDSRRGIGLQANTYGSDIPDGAIRITKATFTKGTLYNVTFVDLEHDQYCDPKTILSGTAIGELPRLTYTGYTFIGWKLDSTQVTSSTIVNGNISLTAVWEEGIIDLSQTIAVDISAITNSNIGSALASAQSASYSDGTASFTTNNNDQAIVIPLTEEQIETLEKVFAYGGYTVKIVLRQIASTTDAQIRYNFKHPTEATWNGFDVGGDFTKDLSSSLKDITSPQLSKTNNFKADSGYLDLIMIQSRNTGANTVMFTFTGIDILIEAE